MKAKCEKNARRVTRRHSELRWKRPWLTFIVASAGYGRNEAERKDNSQRSAGAETAAARAARAAFRVRLETGKLEMSASGTWLAPEMSGSFLERIINGKRVTAR